MIAVYVHATCTRSLHVSDEVSTSMHHVTCTHKQINHKGLDVVGVVYLCTYVANATDVPGRCSPYSDDHPCSAHLDRLSRVHAHITISNIHIYGA